LGFHTVWAQSGQTVCKLNPSTSTNTLFTHSVRLQLNATFHDPRLAMRFFKAKADVAEK
jgi:hypothetical protein